MMSSYSSVVCFEGFVRQAERDDDSPWIDPGVLGALQDRFEILDWTRIRDLVAHRRLVLSGLVEVTVVIVACGAGLVDRG